ncbi:cupredoxin domain-containing protein [Lujinxingia sediminis]|nr:cupredoxin domain-containing protein [Lujinxingia sediminis]
MFIRFAAKAMSIAMLVSLMAFTAACGGGDTVPDDSAAQSSTAPESRSVVLYQFRYNPSSLTVPAGTTVTFKNRDPERHNINIAALNVDQNLDANQEWSYTFNTTGEFAVSNRFNDRMQLTVIVE